MERFHLAYLPATNIEPSIDVSITDCGISYVISVRIATALRLNRCHSRYSYKIDNNVQGDYPSEKSTAGIGIDEKCPSFCCRAEWCSPDSLFPHRSSDDSVSATGYNEHEIVDNDYHKSAFGGATVLAVLVPNLLTRRIIDVLYSIKNLEISKDDKQIIDAEEDLRRSIHPYLCTHGPQGENHIDNHERFNDQQCKNIEENAIPAQIRVRGIITTCHVSLCTNFPADVVILAPTNSSETCKQSIRSNCCDRNRLVSHLSNLLNHDTASNAPWSVLKAFPICSLSILSSPVDISNNMSKIDSDNKAFGIATLPCCPVCLSFIEPTRLGLPELKPQHKCSRWCLSSNDVSEDDARDIVYSHRGTCPNEMKFTPSSQCAACRAIFQREQPIESMSNGSCHHQSPLMLSPAPSWGEQQVNRRDKFSHEPFASWNSCYQCGMTSNLWVCLTCGVVGCGRYTRKHAEEHYTLMGHPYSFELATGRIWDYDDGKFVHRIDLTECPVLSMKLGRAVASAESRNNLTSPLAASSLVGSSGQGGDCLSESYSNDRWSKDGLGDSFTQCHSNLEGNQHNMPPNASKFPAPKKSIMISQEYEALLQSALEDQAQHYQGEISRLRAESATSRMQDSEITDRESREIDALRMDSERLKQDIETLSLALLEEQRKEAKNRSLSQRLLREQSISKELLEKIRKETATVIEQGKQRADDLEMQIDDLSANLKMMSQFAVNEELNQAQICGTTGGVKGGGEKGGKRGKQARRGRKRG